MKWNVLKKLFSVEVLLLWLLRATVSSYASASSFQTVSHNGVSVAQQISQLALVGLVLPWSISDVQGAATVAVVSKKSKKEPKKGEDGTTAAGLSHRKAKQGLPLKKTTANNALLANIDFLTQLTNSKQEKNSEMDPLKCFPKALCGLSAESAAITRRRKNSLITDYIRLMKAVALNPSVMDDTMKRIKKQEADLQNDESGSDSEDTEDEEEEEDDEEEERRRKDPEPERRNDEVGRKHKKGSSRQGPKPTRRTKRKKDFNAKNSDEFLKQHLEERAGIEKLMTNGFNSEEDKNWLAYENEKDPSLEALVDFSGTKLDSQSVESYYTFGGKKKPKPPTGPPQPEPVLQPKAPKTPPKMGKMEPPPRQEPPVNPFEYYNDNYDASELGSAVGNFFRNLFGFNTAQHSSNAFAKDPFFQGFQRSLSDGTPTLVTVDKTKEILTTAIEIGETLKSPNQCNSLFNGCQYQYIELLHVIDDIRESLADKGKHGFQVPPFYSGVPEYHVPHNVAHDGSHGYKSSLTETSEPETLSPDYKTRESQIKTKRKKKLSKQQKKDKYRDGKKSSMSRETLEIGSDEPTMYGSAQQSFDIIPLRNGYHHNYYGSSSYYNHHNSYKNEDIYTRQPKGIWATIMSWFGFGM